MFPHLSLFTNHAVKVSILLKHTHITLTGLTQLATKEQKFRAKRKKFFNILRVHVALNFSEY
jgi:hypothetical protein